MVSACATNSVLATTPKKALNKRLQKKPWILACLLGLPLLNPVQAASFSRLIGFGDSLSDAGSWAGLSTVSAARDAGRFTTNPDLVWTQILANRYGTSATSYYNLHMSGVDLDTDPNASIYAVGGARVSRQDNWAMQDGLIPPLAQQVGGFLRRSPQADPRALYTIWGGANDLFYHTQANFEALSKPATQQATATKIVTAVAGEAVNLVGMVGQLQNAGARYILVANMPDVTKTPRGLANPSITPLWSTAVAQFNSTLSAGLNTLSGNIIAIDTFKLINEIVANPNSYGFKDVTHTACVTRDGQGNITGGLSASLCTRNTLGEPGAEASYLFADSIHPTGAGHQVLAQYAQSVIEAPQQIALLAEVPTRGLNSQTRVIENQLILPRSADPFRIYAHYDFNPHQIDATAQNPDLDSDGHAVTVGGDYALSPQWTVGMAFGYAQQKADFGGNTGGFKMNQALWSTYLAYRQGPAAFYALASLSGLEYKEVRRNIALGAATRTEQGQTKGSANLLRLGGSYDLDWNTIKTGPFVTLTWANTTVNGYGEAGSNATTMEFMKQSRDSMVSSIGWQAAFTQMFCQPWVRLAWEKEHEKSDREVRVRIVGMPASFGFPATKMDGDWARLDLGMAIPVLQKAKIEVAYSGELSRSRAKSNALNVGVQFPF